MHSVLDVTVSCFRNYNTPGNPESINMLKWLNSRKYQSQIDLIRAMPEKSNRDREKGKLPAITPSGTFTHRAEQELIHHSGLIQFDIDLKNGILTPPQWQQLKAKIFKLPFVAYIGFSASGGGLWGLIPISNPEHHKAHFKAIQKVFQKWGIELDQAPQNVSSLRGYSYDPDALFRHDAAIFKEMIFETPKQPSKPCPFFSTDNHNLNGIESHIRTKIRNATDGEKHICLRDAAYWVGGLIAGGQINEEWAVGLLTEEIEAKPNVRDLQAAMRTIKQGIEKGKMRPLYPAPAFERYTLSPAIAPPRPKTTEAPKPPPPTTEDITFSRMVHKYPKLKQFAEKMELVSTTTGKPLQIIPIENSPQLHELAAQILEPRNSYTVVEIQELIKTTHAGVKKLISGGWIEHSGNQRYHLKDSTPF
jgi:hypothetical protein